MTEQPQEPSVATESYELSDTELALVVGGGDGGPGSPTDGTGRSGV